jgi:hypothetical protein
MLTISKALNPISASIHIKWVAWDSRNSWVKTFLAFGTRLSVDEKTYNESTLFLRKIAGNCTIDAV